jgi:hypothetical protein
MSMGNVSNPKAFVAKRTKPFASLTRTANTKFLGNPNAYWGITAYL